MQPNMKTYATWGIEILFTWELSILISYAPDKLWNIGKFSLWEWNEILCPYKYLLGEMQKSLSKLLPPPLVPTCHQYHHYHQHPHRRYHQHHTSPYANLLQVIGEKEPRERMLHGESPLHSGPCAPSSYWVMEWYELESATFLNQSKHQLLPL